MESPRKPETESARLASLRSLQILDTAAEDRFDRITRLASLATNAPIAVVSLVDSDRQWFKSCYGIDVDETPREVSFCGHAILANSPFIIEDTHADPRFSDNPLVTDEPFVRAYAGFPLSDGKGNNLGTLCLIDHRPRSFSQKEVKFMIELAQMAQIELINKSREDALAGWGDSNRRFAAASQIAGHALLVCNTDGTVAEANESTEIVLGSPRKEIVGKHLSSAFGPPFGTEIADASSSEIHDIVGAGFELTCAQLNGTRSILNISSALSDGSDGTVVVAIRDVTMQRATEEHLRDSEQLHRSVLAALSEAVLVVDHKGSILTSNASYPELQALITDEESGVIRFSATATDTKGKLIPRSEWPHFHTLRTGEPVHEQIMGVRHKDSPNEPKWIQFNTQPLIHPESNLPYAAVVSMTDVSERLELERMKSEFVSMVSHELRTPLTAIRGAFGLLTSGIGGHIPPKAASMLAIAETSTERLVRLVNDILDLHRMDSGVERLKMSEFTDSDLIEEVVALMTPLAAETSVSVVKEIEGVNLLADRDRLCQTLCNLIGNAIKFSDPHGTITVSTQADDQEIQVVVSDNGRGIPIDKLDDIFGRFNQVEMSDARDHGGTGLGLAISKQIVEQHGGRIWVDSVFGEGSDFCFTVPLASSADEAMSTPDPSPPPSTSTESALITPPPARNL